jgi:putative MFS transporter
VTVAAEATSSTRFTGYQVRLLVFLGIASFFEGYDFLALAQILPNLRADLGISPAGGGMLVAFINVGTWLAFLLVERADRWGRRKVLTLTIVGYTAFTFLSGLAPNVWAFAAFQLCARTFLIGEWAIATVYAVEEYPANRRGMVIGLLGGFSSLGAIVNAGVAPYLLDTTYGWRSVYFVGVIPLVLLAFARRNLKETRRFAEQGVQQKGKFTAILSSPYRNRVLSLGLIWATSYVCMQTSVTFWKEFAMAERGMSDGQVGTAISIAAVASMPLVFASGKLIDVLGRRSGAVVILLAAAIGTFTAYTFSNPVLLTLALIVGIFGNSALLPLLNAFSTELFPTRMRADGFAWSNQILGRTAYVLAPLAVGWIAQETSWSSAVRATAVFPIVSLVLILALLPETGSKELEDLAGP